MPDVTDLANIPPQSHGERFVQLPEHQYKLLMERLFTLDLCLREIADLDPVSSSLGLMRAQDIAKAALENHPQSQR